MRRHHLSSLVNRYHTFLQSKMSKPYIFTKQIWRSRPNFVSLASSKALKEIVLKLKLKSYRAPLTSYYPADLVQ